MMTQRRSLKIDVGFESCEFTNVASYNDIVNTKRMAQTVHCLGCGFHRIGSSEFDFPAIGLVLGEKGFVLGEKDWESV
ncbi:hypothetical protein DVH24_000955 [Malus domestica]|uniref:Uncharacterized protein n=1 Tax=Malus domestica TaxID=3750 RepID=A0A498JZF6_MALDO|nr:hypothetical protein DVH24_000955 [Malus domestica]